MPTMFPVVVVSVAAGDRAAPKLVPFRVLEKYRSHPDIYSLNTLSIGADRELDASVLGEGWRARVRETRKLANGRSLVDVEARVCDGFRVIRSWYEVNGNSVHPRYYFSWFCGKRAIAGMVNGVFAGIAVWVIGGVGYAVWRWRRL